MISAGRSNGMEGNSAGKREGKQEEQVYISMGICYNITRILQPDARLFDHSDGLLRSGGYGAGAPKKWRKSS